MDNIYYIVNKKDLIYFFLTTGLRSFTNLKDLSFTKEII